MSSHCAHLTMAISLMGSAGAAFAAGGAADAAIARVDVGRLAASGNWLPAALQGELGLAEAGSDAAQRQVAAATASARYDQPWSRHGAADMQLVYGLDYKVLNNNVQALGPQFGNDIAVHPFSVSYLGRWHWPAVEGHAALTMSRNIAGGSGGDYEFTRARAGATPNYNIVRLAASLSRALPRDWQLRAAVNGQYSSDALIPGEQFGASGADVAVRGFAQRDIADDIGLAGNLELYTPNLCGAIAGWTCRALSFYDSAYLKRNRELAGELRSATVGSVGLGLRMLVSRRVNLQLDYGHVVRANATDGIDANRMHLRMSVAY